MTPTQILKSQIDNFSEIMKKNGFEEVNLNKAKSKDFHLQNVDDEYLLSFPEENTNFTHIVKKEIKTDFLKLFKAKTKTDKYSIGLHFTFLNNVEPSIQISLKTNNSFMITNNFSIDEFKEKITNISSSIEDKNIDDSINIFISELGLSDTTKSNNTFKKKM